MTYGRNRNLQLDFLRGVAILLVFGRHLQLPTPSGPVGAFAEVWFRIGWLGVDLFFVLSGFLIGGLLISEFEKHGRIDIARFLVRRGLKIYPLYFIFLAYLVLWPTAQALLRGADVFNTFLQQWPGVWPNLLFLQNYVGHSSAGHLWTLAVEEHFYLFLPFLLAALAASRRIRLLVPICLAAVPVVLLLRCLSVWTSDAFSVTMSATHLRLDALLFGVGIRAVAQYFPENFAVARRRRTLLVVAGVLLWLPNIFIEPASPFIKTFGLTATLLGSAAFLVAAYQTRAEDFGRSSPLVSPVVSVVAWIGVYSYAIYIWHVTAIGILERNCSELLSAWLNRGTSLGWLVAVVLISAGAILVGVAASKVVEWPVLRFRDRLFPTRSDALPTPAVAAAGMPGNAELPLSGPSVRPLPASTECA